ncbi:hypothetical protein [uncultured Gimesia sp.]|uniref:hypothetical protein n=1 Tax=uncultured Gimesia sp. TaxID=1678688 RepID=UPI00263320BC|nr:hypothetical protein [uncultured Gimesia sp.]
MDWLYRGGILHLLPDASGTNLQFATNMSAINAPFDHFRIGAGLIIRHSGQLKELNKKRLLSRKQEVQIAELSAVGATVPIPETVKRPENTYNHRVFDNFNSYLLYQLSELTHPDHNWTMIYLMTGAYLLMIFPGCYFFHKKQKGYRNSLLFILVTVAFFSAMFWSVGKRGYGETTTLNSLVIARPLNGDHYDLTYCVNAFVTDGADYQFTANGEGVIYTSAQELEKVKGAIMNGVDGSFHADIPPFSARSFMCRIKSPYPKPEMKLLEYQIDKNSKLKTLKIKMNSALPKNTSIIQVLYNRVLYDLKQTQEKGAVILELGNRSTPLSAWKSILESDASYNRRFGYRDEETDTPKVYASLYKRLVMKNLNLNRPDQVRTFDSDRSRIKLFFYSDIPDEFKLKTDVDGIQQGRTLFVNEIALHPNMNDLPNE